MTDENTAETTVTKDAPLSPEQIANLAKDGGSYADYEAMRSGRKPAGQRSETPPSEDEDTTLDPGGNGVDTRSSAETEDDDGDPDAGGKAGRGDLPKGVKDRLQRAKRSRDAARHETSLYKKRAEAAEARLAELEAGGGERDPGEGEGENRDTRTQDQGTTEPVSDEPLPEDEYAEKYDYPEEADYVKGEDDAEGLTAFLEDVERWENNIPLKGGKHAQGGGDGGGQRETEPSGDTRTQPDNQPGATLPDPDADSPEARVNQMFADVRETLEDSELEYEGDLAQDFFDQFQGGKFQLSFQMLEWFADNDEAAAKVAKEFAESPRKANRIFRKPPAQHAKLLTEMAQGEGGRRQTRRANRDEVTVVDELNGRRPADPQKALASAVEKGDFKSYEELRRAGASPR